MMKNPARRVVFTYIGDLRTRGRLLKQIETLREAGVSCEVIFGDAAAEPLQDDEFPFPVRSIPVRLRQGRLRSWLDVVRFNRLASRWIARSEADAACAFSLASLPACSMAKARRPGLFVVFDSNELHVENTPGRIRRLLARFQQWRHARRADVIQHAERNRLEYFNRKYSYAGGRGSVLIENFPSYVDEVPRKTDEVRFVYLGGLAPNRHLEEMIDAFVADGSGLELDIYGGGASGYVEALAGRIPAAARDRIRLLGPVPNREVLRVMGGYHAGFAFYRNVNLNSYWCAPNKVYDYLMSGVAVVTNDYPGLVEVVGRSRVGVCVGEIGRESILAALRTLSRERLWENITDEFRRNHSWDGQCETLLAVYGIGNG